MDRDPIRLPDATPKAGDIRRTRRLHPHLHCYFLVESRELQAESISLVSHVTVTASAGPEAPHDAYCALSVQGGRQPHRHQGGKIGMQQA